MQRRYLPKERLAITLYYLKDQGSMRNDCQCFRKKHQRNIQRFDQFDQRLDAFGQFINIEVKWPGSGHDAEVFPNCDIQKSLQIENSSFPINICYLEWNVYPNFYSEIRHIRCCRIWWKSLTIASQARKLSSTRCYGSARIQIVCAFGRLKARWRILMRPMDIPANYLPSIVFACFVLST